MSLAASQQQLRTLSQNWIPAVSNNDLNRNGNWSANVAGGGSNSTLSNRVQSSSCLDLSNNNIGTDRERLKAFLPGYRPAPDYETAVQQKYRKSESELRMNAVAPSMNLMPSSGIDQQQQHVNIYTGGSQPDVHRSSTAVTDEIYGEQLQHKYPDVTQTANSIYQQQQFDMKLLGLSQQLQMMKFNRTISPYAAANRLSSTSTPDLALASHRALLGGYRGAAYVSGSSPDLVSTRTFLNPHLIGSGIVGGAPQQAAHFIPTMPTGVAANTFRYRYSQSHVPHGTYENLNFVETQQTKTNLLSQKLQKAYEDAYRAKPPPPPPTNNGMIKQQHTGSIEPIYENVPLPRVETAVVATAPASSQPNEMRDRASSMQSMPGVMRYKQQQPMYGDTHSFNVSTSSIPPDTAAAPSVATSQTLYTESAHRAIAKSASANSAVPITIKPPIGPAQPQQQLQHHQQQQQQPTPLPPPTESLSHSSNNHTNNNHAISVGALKAIHSLESINTNQMTAVSLPAPAHTNSMNRSVSSNVLDSSHSSSYTNVTTTTDSGISFGTKEKKKRRWGFFGGSKSSLNEKQKSATLGRDRNRSDKSGSLQRDVDEPNFRHRWSTGLQRIPLPASISKEKLVSGFNVFFFFWFDHWGAEKCDSASQEYLKMFSPCFDLALLLCVYGAVLSRGSGQD